MWMTARGFFVESLMVFQRGFVPVELFHLVADGRLNTQEVWLALIIHGLDHGPRGCYASNEYLAKAVGAKNTSTIRRQLAKIKGLGLVQQVAFDGRVRTLRATWGLPLECAKMHTLPVQKCTPDKIPKEVSILSGPTDTDHTAISKHKIEKEDEMFFEQYETKKHHTNEDIKLATQLRQAVRGMKKHINPNLEKWADQIAILTRRFPPAEVAAVLGWYCTNITHPRMYHAWSGEKFKLRYEEIRAWCHKENTPTATPDGVEDGIIKQLEQLTWPHGAGTGVPGAVCAWYRFFSEWLDECRRQADTMEGATTTTTGATRAALHNKAQRWHGAIEAFGTPRGFVTWWFRRYHANVVVWDKWSGKFPEPGARAICDMNAYKARRRGFDEMIEETTK